MATETVVFDAFVAAATGVSTNGVIASPTKPKQVIMPAIFRMVIIAVPRIVHRLS